MDLNLLEDFLELARELNFSRAAAARNMTQPAFSRRIRALEAQIGAPLVIRTTRAVALTPAGAAFQPRAAAILRALADARAEAQETAGAAGRRLNLAATHALSYTFVPRWLMRVAGPAALGTLNMVSDTHRGCVRLMQRGDAGFFIHHRAPGALQDLPERQFRAEVIGADRLVPLCAPDTQGAPRWRLGGDPVPVIGYAPASGLHAILEAHWALHGRPAMTPGMSSVLAATNLEMAVAGQGVAFLPFSLAEPHLARGALTPADDAPGVPVEIVIHRPRARLSPHAEAFWERVRAAN